MFVRSLVCCVFSDFLYEFSPHGCGIASTLLFVYPIMVAVIMSLFFKERISPVTMFSIILALSGIALLYRVEQEPD